MGNERKSEDAAYVRMLLNRDLNKMVNMAEDPVAMMTHYIDTLTQAIVEHEEIVLEAQAGGDDSRATKFTESMRRLTVKRDEARRTRSMLRTPNPPSVGTTNDGSGMTWFEKAVARLADDE